MAQGNMEWTERLAQRVLANLRLTDDDQDRENRKRIPAVTSISLGQFSLRPAFGQRRGVGSASPVRRRGGQPGNANAVRSGRYRGSKIRRSCPATDRLLASCYEILAIVETFLDWRRMAAASRAAGLAEPPFDAVGFLERLGAASNAGWHPALPLMTSWRGQVDDHPSVKARSAAA